MLVENNFNLKLFAAFKFNSIFSLSTGIIPVTLKQLCTINLVISSATNQSDVIECHDKELATFLFQFKRSFLLCIYSTFMKP